MTTGISLAASFTRHPLTIVLSVAAMLAPHLQAQEVSAPTIVAEEVSSSSASILEQQLTSLEAEQLLNKQLNIKNPVRLYITIARLRSALCREGKQEHCPPPPPEPEPIANRIDLDRLAYAVAVAETSNCTAGTGVSKNNCHGIFTCYRSGKCGPVAFASTDESFKAFKKLWMRAYGDRFPTLEDAKRYSNGQGDTWLARVRAAYYYPECPEGASPKALCYMARQ